MSTKLPAWKIRDMKLMYRAGEDVHRIVTTLKVSRQTIMKHCLGIYRRKIKKLTNGERSDLLAVWR